MRYSIRRISLGSALRMSLLLGWAVASLVGSARAVAPEPAAESEWLPAVWPFGRS